MQLLLLEVCGTSMTLKELRLASEDLLAEFFTLDKNSGTLFLMMWCHAWYALHTTPYTYIGDKEGITDYTISYYQVTLLFSLIH
jgi:hypothetical protein